MKDLTKRCIYCAEEVDFNANTCKHCKNKIPNEKDIDNIKERILRNIIFWCVAVGLVLYGVLQSFIPLILLLIFFIGSFFYKFNTIDNHNIVELIELKNKIVARTRLIFFGIITLLIALFFLNPKENQVKDKIKEDYGSWNITNIERQDFKFFSIYSVDMYSLNGHSNKNYFGILNTCIEL